MFNVMHFILIVWMNYGVSLALTSTEFETESACRQAYKDMEAVNNQGSGIRMYGVCVPKYRDRQ